MDTIEAARMARELMNQHKLFDWSFRFDRSRRRLGYCQFREKYISLSEPYTCLNAAEKIKDTILHEIAHALAGVEAGHGRVWKAMAIAVGAKPEACAQSSELELPVSPYRAVCKFCGQTFRRFRLTRHCQNSQYCPCHKSRLAVALARGTGEPKPFLVWERTENSGV